ncbi:ASKHA domain-containing protein [Chloroflexota bacterium]
MADYIIDFEPVGNRGKCRDGESILDCARRLGIDISSVCAGRGTCGTCRVQVTSGKISEPTSSELEVYSPQEIKEGWRLACQAKPSGNCRVMIPPESMSSSQRIQLESMEVAVSPEPAVKAYHLELAEPSLTDQQADTDRLLATINGKHKLSCQDIDIAVLRTISTKIRDWDWKCQVSVRDNELIAVSPQQTRQLGLAVDIGTTTIAAYLVDLSSGKAIASQGVMNPQVGYGEDIISRINYSVKSARDAKRLQKLVVDKLNELASKLCKETGDNVKNIIEAVIVGNTAMHHLFLALPVKQLALTPFIPASEAALDIKARDLGLKISPGAYVHFPPIIAGFIGSDHIATLLAADSPEKDGPVIVLDIGTNTEVSLVNSKEVIATSCASGPAFEGGHIRDGMRAGKGAIEKLRITGDTINFQTIENAPPTGICGSGVLDALAQLYLAGAVDESGRFIQSHPCVRVKDDRVEFVIAEREEQDGDSAIVITQKDIRELQLAKAAIRTGIQLLLEAGGITEEQVKKVVIAGAFGSYIDISSAITVGLLPSLPLNCFHQVGNAAGMGAKLALISLAEREKAIEMAFRVRYLELASTPEFRKTFIETGYLGKYRIIGSKREMLD